MKPYFLVLHNKIKLLIKKGKCKDLSTKGIQLFSRNTKFVFDKTSEIEFGDKIINDGRFVAVVGKNATLKIGCGVYFNEDVMISCHSEVIIGNGCQFGPNVKLFDNNHRFNCKQGVISEHKAAPIYIGENCWIGTNVVILKGVTIGKNTVIGAGCVVSQNIPECSIVTQGRDLIIEPMRK